MTVSMTVSMMAASALAFAAATSGCTSDGATMPVTIVAAAPAAAPIPAGDAPLRVELIDEAIAAVEAQRGGPQQYFEVNATPTIVNLFVADAGASEAVAYVYVANGLAEPAAAQPASGPTFTADEVEFDPARVIAQVVDELPDSTLQLFSVTALEAGGAQYRVIVSSATGAELVVFVSGRGVVLGTDQDLGLGGS
ncbi:MAG: hypothetical protein ABIW84_09225 [Ilumatobacteraceae bacterium]